MPPTNAPSAPQDLPTKPIAPVSAFFYAGAGIFRWKRGKATWWDFDGFDGFPPFLPLFAFRPLHVWDWHMASTEADWVRRLSVYAYRFIPLRWTGELLLRTFLRYWLWLPMLTGLLYCLSAAHSFVARLAGICLFAACVAGLVRIRQMNRRDRQIRLLLGRHRLGSSDPVSWTDELLALIAPSSVWFHTGTFAAACESHLGQKKFAEAMWAARLCAAIEDPLRGEELTENILSDPDAQAELSRLNPSVVRKTIRPWPIVRSVKDASAEYWYAQLFEGQVETTVDVQYAGHVGGMLAYAFAKDDDDATDVPQFGSRDRRYIFGGLAIVAATIAFTCLFVKTAELFRLPTLAEQMIEKQNK
jgi:hypothetical protein